MAPDRHHQARRLLGPTGPASPPRPARHAARRGALHRLSRPPGHVHPPPVGRDLRPLLFRQLALHRHRVQLLRPDRAHLSADPHVVAGRRGAVLSGLASRRPRSVQAVAEQGGPPRRLRGRGSGLGRRDGPPLLPGRRQPALLRDRHPGPVPSGRRRSGRGPLAVVGSPPRGGPVPAARRPDGRRLGGEPAWAVSSPRARRSSWPSVWPGCSGAWRCGSSSRPTTRWPIAAAS